MVDRFRRALPASNKTISELLRSRARSTSNRTEKIQILAVKAAKYDMKMQTSGAIAHVNKRRDKLDRLSLHLMGKLNIQKVDADIVANSLMEQAKSTIKAERDKPTFSERDPEIRVRFQPELPVFADLNAATTRREGNAVVFSLIEDKRSADDAVDAVSKSKWGQDREFIADIAAEAASRARSASTDMRPIFRDMAQNLNQMLQAFPAPRAHHTTRPTSAPAQPPSYRQDVSPRPPSAPVIDYADDSSSLQGATGGRDADLDEMNARLLQTVDSFDPSDLNALTQVGQQLGLDDEQLSAEAAAAHVQAANALLIRVNSLADAAELLSDLQSAEAVLLPHVITQAKLQALVARDEGNVNREAALSKLVNRLEQWGGHLS